MTRQLLNTFNVNNFNKDEWSLERYLKNKDAPLEFENKYSAVGLSFKLGIHVLDIPVLVKGSKKFDVWYSKIVKNFTNQKYSGKPLKILRIVIQDIDLFQKKPCNTKDSIVICPGKIGFIKLRVDTDPFIPGVAFIRGASVGILMVFYKYINPLKKVPYVLTTVQPRIPAGELYFTEIVAGMTDSHENIISKAIEEVQEETGLTINKKDLKNLGTYYPSAGGSDEEITLYLYTKVIKDWEKFKNKVEKGIHGNVKEGEHIQLKLIELDKNFKNIPDFKYLSALAIVSKNPE